jgi:hypothetical protein
MLGARRRGFVDSRLFFIGLANNFEERLVLKKGYEVKEVVETKSGKVHRFYTYNGKPCRRVPIDTRLCKQLAGYALIEKDLRSAAVWFGEIEALREGEREPSGYKLASDRKTYNVIKGLFVAALTFYGKCFSRCEGRPVKLERNQLEEKYRAGHDELIKLRHNFAAHSGDERIEYVEIALVLPRAAKPVVMPNLYRELFQPDLMIAKLGEMSLVDVVEHARAIALRKIEMLSEKILKDEVYPKGRDYWLKK